MALTSGAHHVATLTKDLDRLTAFYCAVLGGAVVLDLREDGMRHALIDLGGGFLLHPFEVPDVAQGEQPIFQRGRLDHLALRAATEEAFWDLRERIYRAKASDGQVTDLGIGLSAGFTDPDGIWGEVFLDRPTRSPHRANWRYIDWPDRS